MTAVRTWTRRLAPALPLVLIVVAAGPAAAHTRLVATTPAAVRDPLPLSAP